MRLFLALLLLLSPFTGVSAARAGGAAYFSALPDLPVASALSEDPNSAVRFDQPEGRVIVLQASGTAQPSEITEFYQKTLPALGWKAESGNRFSRKKESLTLDIKPLGGGHNRLNILLKPQE